MPRYIFFDLDPEIIKPLKTKLPKLLKDENYHPEDVGESPIEFEFFTGPIQDLKRQQIVTHWVSPANSYLTMGGGIDDVYRRIFPDCREKAQEHLHKTQEFFPCKSPTTKKPILAVGSAIITCISSSLSHQGTYDNYLVSMPTMEVPHQIKAMPQNIYYAMRALLRLTTTFAAEDVVAIPGLGTGIGGLTGEQSADQIVRAFQDMINMRGPEYPNPVDVKFQADDHYLIDPPCLF